MYKWVFYSIKQKKISIKMGMFHKSFYICGWVHCFLGRTSPSKINQVPPLGSTTINGSATLSCCSSMVLQRSIFWPKRLVSSPTHISENFLFLPCFHGTLLRKAPENLKNREISEKWGNIG